MGNQAQAGDGSFPGEDATHFVFKGNRLKPPFPDGMEMIVLGMGCFWCSEQMYFKSSLAKTGGLYSTHVGYAQGKNENPTYKQVCGGATGHSEVVRLVYDPKKVSLVDILTLFWENHNPTTLNQQREDRGTQYRSGIYYYNEDQKNLAEKSRNVYEKAIGKKIVTEIEPAETFYYAENYHQQYDAKPGSRDYHGLAPLNIAMPTGWAEAEDINNLEYGKTSKAESNCWQ